uniref:Ig-like domain-containing protein n=1 Tax=Sparus aurata TaxID=8175 RepID=A0A671W179_SPAAU
MEKQITVWIGAVLLLAALNCSEAQVISEYFVVGSKLDLRPTVTETITDILWRYNGNLVAEWVQGEVELLYYDKYKDRTTLKTATGQLVINNMEKDDVGSYTVDINNKAHGQSYDVKWITRVRKPSVLLRTLTCGPDSESCLFTCEVKEADSLSDAGPIEYSWKIGEKDWKTTTNDITVTSDQTDTESIETISCRMKNPVSQEDSEPPLHSNMETFNARNCQETQHLIQQCLLFP